MDKFDSPMMNGNPFDRIDAAFSELSRAVGPMLLVFGLTAVGWLILHAL